MTKTLENHLKEAEQKRARVAKLKHNVQQNERELSELEEQYKSAVVNDSKNIDDLFHDMEALKNKLKADRHKLQTLEGVTEEHLRKDAVKVLEGFQGIKPKYKDKAAKIKEKIAEEIERHQKEISKFKNELQKVNDDYQGEAEAYWKLIEANKIVGELAIKKSYPSLSLLKPELREKIEQEESEAIKTGKLISFALYKDIEKSANGEIMITTEGVR